MSFELRYNTADQIIPLGYFLDSSDGDTEETGLTIANTDIKIWKWGATALASKNSGGGTHISNGIYYTTLDATDTNTIGPAKIYVHISGAIALEVEISIVSQQYWDAKYGSGNFSSDVIAVSGDSAAADNLEAACDNYSVTRGLSGTALPAAAADAAGGLPISDAGGLDLDTKLANTNEVTAARMGALTDWIDGGRLDLLLDAIPTTPMRGTDNAATEAKQDIIDTNVDTLITRLSAANAQILADWIDGGRLDLLLDGAASAGDPWTTALPGAYGAGTAGKIVGDNVDAPISGVPTVSEIQAEMEENGASLLDTIRDAIESGTYGLSALKTIIDELTSQGDTNEGKLDTIAGYIDTEIGTIITAVGTTLVNHLLDIKGTGFAKDTHSLPQCLTATGFSTHDAAAVKTAIEAAGSHLALMKAIIDALPDAGALTTIGTDTARLTAARAGVLTDWIDGGRLDLLLDAVKVVTDLINAAQTEPGQEAPAVNATPLIKLAHLYKAYRNKKDNDGSTRNLYNDAGDTVDQTSSVSEAAGTVTVGEVTSGP